MTEQLQRGDRRKWLAVLAKLVQPGDGEGAAKALAAMLPMLADLPDAAFTLASLEHVARQCRRLPSYGELRTELGVWWQDNRPSKPALPSPDQTASALWTKRQAELRAEWDDPAGIRAKVRTLTADYPGVKAPRQLLAILVARWAPQHFGWIPPDWAPNVMREMSA